MMEDVTIDGKTYKPWQFKPGNPGGPGRKPGKTLKEYAREFLALMTDEERQEFMGGLSKEVIWKMAEGNPHNSEDITSKGEAIQPLLVKFIDGKPGNTNTDTPGV